MSIKFIGAGLPRTGTNTLKRALETLGYAKTYHMKELLNNPEKLSYWLSMESSGTMDYDTIYDGFVASVDFPCYPWYKEHMEKYPEAKVILTTRPFDKWYKSLESTIWTAGPQTLPEKLRMMSKLIFDSRLRKVIGCVKLAKRQIFEVSMQNRFGDIDFARKMWEAHHEDVKKHVPAEKLLIYEVKDGWGPLCDFLGVPEPSEPLPHLNKKENFKSMLAGLMNEGKMVEL